MRRAPLQLLKTAFVVVATIVAGGVVAGNAGAASDAARRPSNSFNLFVAPPPVASPVRLPSHGVGLAPGKTTIMDPYKVPLIQNAGSMSPGR